MNTHNPPRAQERVIRLTRPCGTPLFIRKGALLWWEPYPHRGGAPVTWSQVYIMGQETPQTVNEHCEAIERQVMWGAAR